jgi:hypothetical protein
MFHPTRRSLAVVIALVAVIIANLLVDVGLIWFMEERRLPNWLNEIAIGTLLSQVALLGLWLGLGDGRWYVRLVVALPLTMCTAKAMGWATTLSAAARRQGSADEWAMFAFILIAMMLATSLLALVLRRTRSWRLTWWQVARLPPTQQFQAGDVLLWMIPIAGSLAAIRFMMSIDENFGDQLVEISLYTGRTAAIALVTMTTAFGTRRRLRSWLVLAMLVLIIGAVFAAPDAYSNIQRMRASANKSVPLARYATAAVNQMKTHEIFTIAAAVAGLTNCLILRWLGCKLIRPGAHDNTHNAA